MHQRMSLSPRLKVCRREHIRNHEVRASRVRSLTSGSLLCNDISVGTPIQAIICIQRSGQPSTNWEQAEYDLPQEYGWSITLKVDSSGRRDLTIALSIYSYANVCSDTMKKEIDGDIFGAWRCVGQSDARLGGTRIWRKQ